MPKLRTLGPLVRSLDTRTTKPPPRDKSPKQRNPIYNTREFQAWRGRVIARAGARCEAVDDHGNRCSRAYPEHRVYADHIIELRDGGQPFDVANGSAFVHRTTSSRPIRPELTDCLGDKDHIPHNPPVMSPRIRIVVMEERTVPKEAASPESTRRRTQAQNTRKRYRSSRRVRSY